MKKSLVLLVTTIMLLTAVVGCLPGRRGHLPRPPVPHRR
jgi:hypothetical protein